MTSAGTARTWEQQNNVLLYTPTSGVQLCTCLTSLGLTLVKSNLGCFSALLACFSTWVRYRDTDPRRLCCACSMVLYRSYTCQVRFKTHAFALVGLFEILAWSAVTSNVATSPLEKTSSSLVCAEAPSTRSSFEYSPCMYVKWVERLSRCASAVTNGKINNFFGSTYFLPKPQLRF